ncbi:MFS general substrate transporter [Punctularia strigosozonata HHB-11173 SS5]|uniref:MFS general substrate transporter n=1 Tax=Punctularia strigosozonata (strain HHB-11173) TaxID=741275 RepID=R7S2E7_PUNST|nr:MFS general substrate transporter [Punctularia strigosozonata HHB-11173 SS5]EIN03957.1 MFS general substrate transporter [Punctularia strigosozonata HHB-11173 SS5]
MEYSRSTSYAPSTATAVAEEPIAERKDSPCDLEKSGPVTSSSDPPDPLAPYPEGGRGWIVVLGCSLLCAVSVGFGYVLAWGVFQSYYENHILVGTSASVLSLLGGMPGLPFLAAGSIVWIASMISIAFCTELWQFFISQGVMQGLAAGLIFPLIVSLPSQWFLRRRSLATGIVLASSSFGGAVSSPLIRGLLSDLGLRKTMAIKTSMDAITLAIGFLLIKERKTPGSRVHGPDGRRQRITWLDGSILKDTVFWSLAMCLFFCCMGFLTPMFFMTEFTLQKVPGISSIHSVLPLTILNLAAGLGRILVGHVADGVGVVNALFVAVLGSGLAQLLVWNFVSGYAGIMGLSITYGLFSGCFLSLTSPVAARLYGAGRLAGLSGLLFLYVAPGQLAGATISGAIYASTKSWHAVIAYSGGIQIVAAACLLYARFKKEPRFLAIL